MALFLSPLTGVIDFYWINIAFRMIWPSFRYHLAGFLTLRSGQWLKLSHLEKLVSLKCFLYNYSNVIQINQIYFKIKHLAKNLPIY